MIINDRKPITSLIMQRMKDGKSSSMEVKNEKSEGDVDELQIAAEDILQAIQDKSVLGMKEALKSFWDLIKDEDEKEDEEEYENKE